MHFLLLGLIGTKEPVPDDKDPGEILVDVFIIGAVMHAVIGWRVKDILQRAESAYSLSVQEELKEQVQCIAPDDKNGWQADQHQWDIEGRADEHREPVEPVGHCQVHLLAGMVYEVKGPEELDDMGCTMKPVIAEIYQHKCDKKRQRRVLKGVQPEAIEYPEKCQLIAREQ